MPEDNREADWNPRDEDALENPIECFDQMRRHCPVAYSDYMGWSAFRHADVLAVVSDHRTFSNRVSRHRSVPNGLDQPEHTPYRELIEPFFTAERMARFEPHCRDIARQLSASVAGRSDVEVIGELAEAFALKIQCAFMGWPDGLQETLRRWARENHRATLAGDRDAMAEVARRFTDTVHQLIETRRQAGDSAPEDVTTELINSRIEGRPIPDSDIVSILRNWTVGEIGTIAASVGLLVKYLSDHRELQDTLRSEPERIPEAVDEILRIHGPLITNRRKATQATTLGGRRIEAGDRLSVNWVAANRDEQAFPEPECFRWARDQSKNLLYGAGLHVCPGAPLARLELRVLLEELLNATSTITRAKGRPPVGAHYPASGYRQLWVDF